MGKTTVLVRVILVPVGRGLRVATLKPPPRQLRNWPSGKGLFRAPQGWWKGGAGLIGPSLAPAYEPGDEPETTLARLTQLVKLCDRVVVAGFKREAIPEIKVFQKPNARSSHYLRAPPMVGVASDVPVACAGVAVVDLDDPKDGR